jgi:hypothetical protein
MSTDPDFDHLAAGVRAPVPPRLADLLAAAAAPARPDELAREQDMVVAFRQARLAQTPASRRRLMMKLALAKLLTVKAVGATAAAMVAGGVAMAATGNIPGPLGNSGAAELRPAPAQSAEPAGHGGVGARGEATPSPSVEGLCVAYLAQVAEAPGRALESPAFQVLISKAGGDDEVGAFCADLVESLPGDGTPLPFDGLPGGVPESGLPVPPLPTPPGPVTGSEAPPSDLPGPPQG